ncbi:MAG: ATP-dependent DNA helicase [Actinobacteria bacterium]|nr:MAG: ATP-dependent DNA helicase [Actinomycetota bacterium]
MIPTEVPWAGDASMDAHTLAQMVDPGRLPTAEQTHIIEAPTSPLLVVAGAGAGKTETMSMRVLWLVAHQGFAPDTILGLTFTRKAAAELGTRLRQRLDTMAEHIPALTEAGYPTSLTYNSFAQRIVAEHGQWIGVESGFRTLGQAGAVQMMHDIVSSFPSDIAPDRSISSLVSNALSLAGHLAEHDYTVEGARLAFDEFSQSLREIGKPTSDLKKILEAHDLRYELLDLVDAFQKRKREEGVLDYSDQILLATQIVTSSPEVVRDLRNEYQAVLLDEFQDTSVIQMKMLSTIFRDHPVTAVGDPNQAIYGWRGASAASLESFLNHFDTSAQHLPEQTLTLSTAWRNDQRILSVANVISRPLRDHSTNAKSPVLTPRPGAGSGSVEVSYGVDRESQVEAIADFIEQHRRPQGSSITTSAVLCRRRKDFLEIDRALRSRDIPTQIIGVGGLLDLPAVADIRAALEVSVDVDASPSLMRLLTSLDIGTSDLRLLGEWARHLASQDSSELHPPTFLLDAVDTPPPPQWSPREGAPCFTQAAHDRVTILGQRLRALRAGSGRGIVEAVERAITIMGITEDILADPLNNGGREALDAFVDIASSYENDAPDPTLQSFLAWLSVAETEERGLEGPQADLRSDAVHIMTIHGAKGLEWDTVAVCSLDDGVFPKHSSPTSRHWRETPAPANGWLTSPTELPDPLRGDCDELPLFDPELGNGRTPQASFNKWVNSVYREKLGAHHEREERRLAYVALTRARSALFLTGSWIDYATQPKQPSRYLMEPLESLRRWVRDAFTGDISALNFLGNPTDDELRELARSLDRAVIEEPSEEEIRKRLEAEEQVTFPPLPGRSRQLLSEAAKRVKERIRELDTDRDVLDELAQITGHPLVTDVIALVEERRLKEESPRLTISTHRLPATTVSRLFDDKQTFAQTLRRPLPSEPSEAAALGTIVHAWIERQLRQTTGELWDEPALGITALSRQQKERFETIAKNFSSLALPGRVKTVEHPFALDIAGISVQGRIDAVFQDNDGDTVIDWKTGRSPHVGMDPAQLRSYVTQLRLYQMAWAEYTGVDVDTVRAQLVFLEEGSVWTLSDLEERAGITSEDLGTQMKGRLTPA